MKMNYTWTDREVTALCVILIVVFVFATGITTEYFVRKNTVEPLGDSICKAEYNLTFHRYIEKTDTLICKQSEEYSTYDGIKVHIT